MIENGYSNKNKTKAMKRIILLYFVFLSVFANAQNFSPVIRWQKSLGGNKVDVPYKTIQTSDNKYVTVGHTYSNNGDVRGAKGQADIWVVKQDGIGNIEWEMVYGGTGDDDVSSVIETKDGGYIFVGGTGSIDGDITMNHGDFDVWVVKLSSAGIIEWQKTYGGSADEAGHSIIETADGGYAIAAETDSYGHGYFDYLILKIDSIGSLEWQKNYGGRYFDVPRSILQTLDGGFIVGGYASSKDSLNNLDIKGLHNTNDYDGWIIKISSKGVLEWQKCIGGKLEDRIYSIIQAKDKDFVAVGYTLSVDGDITNSHGQYDYFVLKFDSVGTIKWLKNYGGSSIDMASSIIEDTNGGFVVAGYSQSIDGQVTNNHGMYDYWLLKIDNSENLIWQKTFGDTKDDIAYSVLQTGTDIYTISGESLSTNKDVQT
jgi:hypothetical protein